MDCLPGRGQPGALRTENWSKPFIGKMTSARDSCVAVIWDCRARPDSLPAELTECLCRSSTEGQHLAAALRLFKKVCPVLHHLGAGLQVEGVIVGGTHGITRGMGKL